MTCKERTSRNKSALFRSSTSNDEMIKQIVSQDKFKGQLKKVKKLKASDYFKGKRIIENSSSKESLSLTLIKRLS
jgi:hypothetical protein